MTWREGAAVGRTRTRNNPIYPGIGGVIGDRGRNSGTVAGDHGGGRQLRHRNGNEGCLGASFCRTVAAAGQDTNSDKTAEHRQKRLNPILPEAFLYGSYQMRGNAGHKTSARKRLQVAVGPMRMIRV